MIRVVIDTNVLVSGTFWLSDSFQVLQLIDGAQILLVVSPPILTEYDELLHREEIMDKAAYSRERVESVEKLLLKALLVEPKTLLQVIKADPDDDKFLEAAIAGNATYLISQDKKHLLSLKEFRGIKIISPEEFLKVFERR